jgi:hypothetical protein
MADAILRINGYSAGQQHEKILPENIDLEFLEKDSRFNF